MANLFYRDLAEAKKTEELVRDVLSGLTFNYTFKPTDNEHKGDIIATDWYGNKHYIEVKDDSRIYKTHNVLCEEEVYFHEGDYTQPGNFYSDYEIYCVVSRPERKIYVIDFKKLHDNYKKGEYKVVPHAYQTTYCYLCSLGKIKQWGALIDTIEY